MTTIKIDCESCPVRGLHCGDCFVPVLGQVWLQTPTVPRPPLASQPVAEQEEVTPRESGGVALDDAERHAVSVLVRGGLVDPQEAARARAEIDRSGAYAVS